MRRVPGRASSLASVGLLLGLSVLVGALGYRAGTGQPTSSANVHVNASAPRARASGTGQPSTTDTTVGPIETQSFRCPAPAGPGGGQHARLLEWSQPGLVVTASTFCSDSAWYVSERTASRTTVVAKPFKVPDDPPIPPAVTAERFVPLRKGVLPAVLVERERFATASIYELFTLASGSGVNGSAVSGSVEPMNLGPGGSPVLLLRSSSELQGAGFRCSEDRSGEVIRQYEWYVVNPTTLETTASGKVLGDPQVFFQTTVYTFHSGDSFEAATLTTTTRGYTSAAKLSDSSC